ncbi:MAG: carboxypeptidase regulatory-like domain-containing protein [Verrucomicrobia bacterium]|nr:carboxypeptidase regulatory-like domain-containing protein [Verrucomicrobiota bacterium]
MKPVHTWAAIAAAAVVAVACLLMLRFASDDEGAKPKGVKSFTPDVEPPEPKTIAKRPGLDAPIVEETATDAPQDADASRSHNAAVSGRVVDADGNPVARAGVLLANDGMTSSVCTDKAGAFSVSSLCEGTFAVTADARDFVTYEGLVEVPSDNVLIVLDRGCWITGRVIDKETREPVESFRLSITPQLPAEGFARIGWEGRRKLRDEVGSAFSMGIYPDGRFAHAGFRPWTFTLSIESDDYLPAEITEIGLKEGVELEEIVVELDRGAEVEVVVTAASDGSLVAGARVILDNYRPRVMDDPPDFPTTNADGVCRLKSLMPRDYSCRIEHEHYQYTEVNFDLAPGEMHKTVAVALEAGLSVHGVIVSKSDGLPIEGASVHLDGPRTCRATTDEMGRFALDVVDPGRYRFLVEAEGFAPHREMIQLDVAPGGGLYVELGRGGAIAGTVLAADGAPIEGAAVQVCTAILDRPWTYGNSTDAEGAFRIDMLPPEAYRVVVTQKRSVRSILSQRVVVREGEVTRADFVLGAGAAVFGRITRGEKPVFVDVKVSPVYSALLYTDSVAHWTRANRQGYRVEGLGPGQYVLFVDFEEHTEKSVSYEFSIADTDVELNVDLDADAIAGVVQREDGSPCEMASVELVPRFADTDRITTINTIGTRTRGFFWTDQNGAFRITGVAPGRYCLSVDPPWRPFDFDTRAFESEPFATAVVDLTKEDGRDITDLVVTLRDIVEVEGRLTTDNGVLPNRVTLMISDDAGRFLTEGGGSVESQTGRFPVGRLAPGDYSILANAPGYGLARANLHVAAEGNTRFDLALTQAHNLVVSVADATGSPVPGANVILDLDADVRITASTYDTQFYADFDKAEFLASDAAGRKAFRAIGDGAYTLRVRCDGYEDASVPVTIAGQDAQATVTLKPRTE